MSSHQPSATIGEITRKPSRVRLAAIVYAIVVIIGLAGTGAHAAWSQSGSVVSNVTTGNWGPQKVTGVSCSGKFNAGLNMVTIGVSYTTPADADEVKTTIAKGGNIVSSFDRKGVEPSHSYKEWLPTPLKGTAKETFVLTVTPFYGKTPGESTTKEIRVTNHVFGTGCS